MTYRIRNALPHQDNPFFRKLHIVVAVLILAQIINSNLTDSEALGELSLTGIVTLLHIIIGTGLLLSGFVMLFRMMTRRGFRYYFSWVFMDFRGMAVDFRTLSQFRLPEAHAGWIASVVQGLGVVLLLGVATCGGLWFVLA